MAGSPAAASKDSSTADVRPHAWAWAPALRSAAVNPALGMLLTDEYAAGALDIVSPDLRTFSYFFDVDSAGLYEVHA